MISLNVRAPFLFLSLSSRDGRAANVWRFCQGDSRGPWRSRMLAAPAAATEGDSLPFIFTTPPSAHFQFLPRDFLFNSIPSRPRASFVNRSSCFRRLQPARSNATAAERNEWNVLAIGCKFFTGVLSACARNGRNLSLNGAGSLAVRRSTHSRDNAMEYLGAASAHDIVPFPSVIHSRFVLLTTMIPRAK